jgi:hypothetical protein
MTPYCPPIGNSLIYIGQRGEKIIRQGILDQIDLLTSCLSD